MKKLNFESVPSDEVLSREQLTKIMGGVMASCQNGYSSCTCKGTDWGCRTPSDCNIICDNT